MPLSARSRVETTLAPSPAPRQAVGRLTVETPGAGFTDLTPELIVWVEEQGVCDGLLTLFCQHTSASLTIQENADPDVRRDLLAALRRLAPEDAAYAHSLEGPDDMPAHIKAVLTGVSLAVPLVGGCLALGTWQAVYLVEHRARAHRRELVLHLLGA
jgi:secondary thiamine-phosphate synthase enzyme